MKFSNVVCSFITLFTGTVILSLTQNLTKNIANDYGKLNQVQLDEYFQTKSKREASLKFLMLNFPLIVKCWQ